MKFTLLICISLLFSMFHAVAMPISNLGNTPMTTEAPMIEMKHMGAHCDNLMQDDIQMQNCCSGVALQSIVLLPLMSRNPQKLYRSLSPRLNWHTPDALFKPPKAHPLFIG